MSKRAFISFDVDNDSFLRDSLKGQAKNEKSPFEFDDWSVKIPWDEDKWKKECRTKIKKTNVVIVMVGQYTKNCSGVKAEIKMANEEGIPAYGIKGYADKECPRPDGLKGYYKWTWSNVKWVLDQAL